MVVLFILCLFVVLVIVVRGNLNKCEVNFQGTIATKDVNLRQWPLNHLSIKLVNTGTVTPYHIFFTLCNDSFCVNRP